MTTHSIDANLIWLDMEMTGLDPQNDRIIELAIVITDSNLNILASSHPWAIQQSEAVITGMDEWNQKMHGKSGLIERVRKSNNNEETVEALALKFIQQWVEKQHSPMCGNSICQDRRFMARYMPKLELYFHYRNLDVSTLKELARRWAPAVVKSFTKANRHEALSDIYDSINELKHYREHFLIN